MQKEKEKSLWWVSLYNCLFILINSEETLGKVKQAYFDVMEELEVTLDNGINTDSLSFFIEKDWVTETQKKELENFKSTIEKISPEYWKQEIFYNSSNQDWQLVKKWGLSLFEKLGFEDEGWNEAGFELIKV